MRRPIIATNRILACAVLAAVISVPGSASLKAQSARDYTQWRGPNRDGSAVAFVAPKKWPEKLTQRWKMEVGLGYGTPLLVGNRLFTFTRRDADEVMTALDAASGKVIWQVGYAAPYKEHIGTRSHGPGPKSTPVYYEGKLYTLGIAGVVSAFDASNGKLLWQKPAPPVLPLYGTGMSPVADRGLVIFHMGGHDDGALTAFDAKTGDVRWAWTGDGPSYGSPMVVELGGTRQVVAVTQKNIVGLDITSGGLLWQRPVPAIAATNSFTPIIHRDLVIVSGHDAATTALRPVKRDGKWTVDVAWETREVEMKLSNPVVIGDTLYGLSRFARGQYIAIDLNTGTVVWKSNPRPSNLPPGVKPSPVQSTENGGTAFVKAGELLFYLNDEGQLTVAKGTKAGIEPIQQYTVSDVATWAQPTIVGNRIFVKDTSALTLWTID